MKEKIDYDTYNQLYSLMECGRVPTKVELDRFIKGLGYRLPPAKTPGATSLQAFRERRNGNV